MQSTDHDFRFMGLNDLMTEIKQDQSCFIGDEALENKVLMQVLALVEDKISEVKNQAVKWYLPCFRYISRSCVPAVLAN
jgi:cullin-associated NEDD8-dissociated protein 1